MFPTGTLVYLANPILYYSLFLDSCADTQSNPAP